MAYKQGTKHAAVCAMAAMAAVAFFCTASADPAPRFKITVPSESLSFDEGMDARDALNRPVARLEAREQLRSLFVSATFLLLTRAELPRVAAMLAVLERTWSFAQRALTGAAAFVFHVWVDLWNPPTRRFGPPRAGGALFLALFLALQAGPLWLLSCRIESTLKSLHSTLLRC